MNRKDADTARRLGPSAWRDDWMTRKETPMDEPATDGLELTAADRAILAAQNGERCIHVDPDRGRQCTLTAGHDTHIANGGGWTLLPGEDDVLPVCASQAATATHSAGDDAGAAHGADGSAQANSALRELMRATGFRELMRSTLRDAFTHHITAEWICCGAPQKGHKLCKQGHTTLGMVMALLDDRSPILAALDAAVTPAIRELHEATIQRAEAAEARLRALLDQHQFQQRAGVPVLVCTCGKWPSHHVHIGESTRTCGCDECRTLHQQIGDQ